MSFDPRPRFTWHLRSRNLPLGRRTLLAGILNVTPDSFSDTNRFLTVSDATDHALRMLDDGADLIDIGGESTRPNSTPVSAGEEQSRILPVMRAVLKLRPQAILSADTYHASTAAHALDSGAEIINDVSGLLWDPEMADVVGRARCGVILMHTRGAPRLWPSLPPLPHSDILPLIVMGLSHSMQLARAAGISDSSIVLDPGFGFGKSGDENFALLAHLEDLQRFSVPLLVGTSRKRFLVAHLHAPTEESRLQATSASHVAAILSGAHLLRVHDVAAARACASVADAILAGGNPGDFKDSPSRISNSRPIA